MLVDQEFQYYYGSQIRNYIEQFSQVFSEMYVTVGKNGSNTGDNHIRLPIFYGSMDKTVAAIKAGNTQNKLLRAPAFSILFEGIQLDRDRQSGTNTQSRKTVLPVGGDIKTDLKVVYTLKPLPYTFNFSVAVLCSNTDQLFQICEQILLIFDPFLQFQTGDGAYDWTKMVDALLTDVELSTRGDNDGRYVTAEFKFAVKGYMAPPANITNNAITKIKLRVDAVAAANYPVEVVAADVDREEPKYTVIYDLSTENIPAN